jgi:UDP-2,3-diacylglucosamine pyrophosphatase LpxH
MLVIISDLHLNDGSAAPENISPKAFAIWMQEILALAVQNQAKELVFLYLGDMVDLLRTEYWFYPKPGEALGERQAECFPLEHRPWGVRDINQHPEGLGSECRARALQILRRTCQEAKRQLAYLRGDAEDIQPALAGLGIPVRRIYVPGNHDRLFWVDAELRQELLNAFGAEAAPAPRPFEVWMPEYGLLARHGHEWDPWNFEDGDEDGLPAQLDVSRYQMVPIGDPITTELVARLPFAVASALPATLEAAVRDHVYKQLRHVEDVRPLSQALRWVLAAPRSLSAGYDKTTQDLIIDAVDRAAKEIVAEFMRIPFVKAWIVKHDKATRILDEADKLQAIGWVAKRLHIKNVDRTLKWFEKAGLTKEADEARAADRELRQDASARFCVYGHTHNFRHVPLGNNPQQEDFVYLNSGTWRPRVAQTQDGKSFASYKEMTYLVFYRADEDLGSRQRKGLSYELWNGVMKK